MQVHIIPKQWKSKVWEDKVLGSALQDKNECSGVCNLDLKSPRMSSLIIKYLIKGYKGDKMDSLLSINKNSKKNPYRFSTTPLFSLPILLLLALLLLLE